MRSLTTLAMLTTIVVWAGAIVGAAAAEGVKVVLELPPTQENPRNSEGAFLPLRDGKILFVYTHFTGGAADHSNAHLAARVSTDGGATWSKTDAPVPTVSGKQNVMSVSLLRLASGEVALFYLVKNSGGDCRPFMQVSKDEGQTWGTATACIATEGYYVVNNDRVIQLKNGRLVMPAALHTAPGSSKFIYRCWAMCWVSDDAGKTWKASNTIEAPPASKTGLQEPGVIELKDGRLMMLCRTDQGCQMRSYSADGGLTWAAVEKTDIASPVSPMSIKRHPKTGELWMVWNNTKGGKRTPLTVGISKDEGQTWQSIRDIETDPDGWYCYTAICFVADNALLAYCAGEPKNRLGRTRVVLVETGR